MRKPKKTPNPTAYIAEIKQIVDAARTKVYSAVNTAMVEAYWLIGRRLVMEEQHGADRAEYGKEIIQTLSAELTAEYGRGFSETNLVNFRKFYLRFRDFQIPQTVSDESSPRFRLPKSAGKNRRKKIPQTVSDESDKPALPLLSWSHYERLLRVENAAARWWYMREAVEQMWSVRALDRNINTQYYERLLLSPSKHNVIREMRKKTASLPLDKWSVLKNPTVMEFLDLPPERGYTERDLEKKIIDHLQTFIMEIGKGFAFIARQQLIRTEAEDYYLDLVFYNYLLKCFVLIDLKIGKITHQDVGQMDMYVRMYDELKRGADDNPTLGIVLCSETDRDIARYSLLKGNERLFATKYKLYLPTEAQLRAEIEQQKELLKIQLAKSPQRKMPKSVSSSPRRRDDSPR